MNLPYYEFTGKYLGTIFRVLIIIIKVFLVLYNI